MAQLTLLQVCFFPHSCSTADYVSLLLSQVHVNHGAKRALPDRGKRY